jgi:hypothetical protein
MIVKEKYIKLDFYPAFTRLLEFERLDKNRVSQEPVSSLKNQGL